MAAPGKCALRRDEVWTTCEEPFHDRRCRMCRRPPDGGIVRRWYPASAVRHYPSPSVQVLRGQGSGEWWQVVVFRCGAVIDPTFPIVAYGCDGEAMIGALERAAQLRPGFSLVQFSPVRWMIADVRIELVPLP